MGQIVATLALSHAPGLTGWLDQAPADQQKALTEGFTALGEMLRATRPDVIIGIANDHLLNLPLENTSDFCVGIGDCWSGPAEWFQEWVNVPPYEVPGHRDLGRALVRFGGAAGARFAFADKLLFDDNWSVPLHYLSPRHDVPLVPIHMNCIVPPLPSPRQCYDIGRIIADVIRHHRPAEERVAIMATGGLSHDPGGPKYFAVDEAFDREFLRLVEAGNPEALLQTITIERMMAAGDGGTTELLSWIVALGAAGGAPARTVCYVPSIELRCGMGCVFWEQPRAH